MTKTTVQVLREAKYVVQAGWTQGAFATSEPFIKTHDNDIIPKDLKVAGGDEHGKCFCAWGALNKVQGGALGDGTEMSYLSAAVLRRDPGSSGFVPRYNDAVGRTKEEMLSLFDEAIELAQRA
jgi:hypothetical protein